MRIVLFLLIVSALLFLPWWIYVPLAILYAFWRPAYELIVIGVIIDASFGVASGTNGILYTVGLGSIVFVAELLKPYISYYDVTYETP